MRTIALHYTETLVRSAVKAFWLRVTGWRFFTALTLLLVILVYDLVVGDRSWMVGVLGSVFALGLIFVAALYFVHYHASFRRFRRMRVPEGTLELGDRSFRIASDVGASDILWSTISGVWRFPDFWLLFLSRSQFITLPLADLDSDAREFILERVKSQGAEVS
ncbi:MAG: YcxB family protein [Candidatus Acidiferrales bacterium]